MGAANELSVFTLSLSRQLKMSLSFFGRFFVVLLVLLCAKPARSADLVLALATYPAAHHVLDAGRSTWRKDLYTVVSTQGPNDEPERELEQPFPHEVWVSAPDGGVGWEGGGGNRAEGRCVGLIRVANRTAGLYNWLLSSDDDVVWYEDNVRSLTNRLDASQPLYITDGFLNDVWNACALPADAPLTPLHTSVNGAACQRAPPTQPCLRSVLEQPEMCRSATVRGNQPGTWANSSVPLQVGAYGNAGSLMSRGLLASLSPSDFEACEKCNSSSFTCMFGADWRLGECFLAFVNCCRR